MPAPSAIYSALDLVKHPILAPVMRRHPLPQDVLTLIRIAAGSEDAIMRSAAATGYDAGYIRSAAVFYIQQVLWARSDDPYRTLGVAPDANPSEMAEHLRWLMKWLHPDASGSDASQSQAERVLAAWTELKTPERRRSYDRSQTVPRPKTGRRADRHGRRIPWILPSPKQRTSPFRLANWRVLAIAGVGGVAALTFLFQALSS